MFCAPNNIFAIFSQATRAVISSDICAGAVTPPFYVLKVLSKVLVHKTMLLSFWSRRFISLPGVSGSQKLGGGMAFKKCPLSG